MKTKSLLLLFLMIWSVASLGVFMYFSGTDNGDDQWKQDLKNDIDNLRKDIIDFQNTKSTNIKAPSTFVISSTSSSHSPNPSIPKQVDKISPSVKISYSTITQHDLNTDKELNNRVLHENTSDLHDRWEGSTSSFLHAFSSIITGDSSRDIIQNYLKPSPSVLRSPKRSISIVQSLVDFTTDLEKEHWNDVKYQISSRSTDELEFIPSCAGLVDEFTLEDLSPFNAIVLGSGVGYFTEQLSKEYPHSTILAFERRDELSSIHYKRLHDNSRHNTYICRNTPNADLAELLSESNIFFRFQFIMDLVPLMTELLPHEFEEALGNIFSISQTTFLFIPDENEIGVAEQEDFFTYWPEFNQLIYNAFATKGLQKPKITFLSSHRVFRIDMITGFTTEWEVCLNSRQGNCTEPSTLKFQFNPESLKQENVATIKGTKSTLQGSSFCSGFPLSILLDFDLFPDQIGDLSSSFSFSGYINQHSSAFTVPDLVYISKDQFTIAPFGSFYNLFFEEVENITIPLDFLADPLKTLPFDSKSENTKPSNNLPNNVGKNGSFGNKEYYDKKSPVENVFDTKYGINQKNNDNIKDKEDSKINSKNNKDKKDQFYQSDEKELSVSDYYEKKFKEDNPYITEYIKNENLPSSQKQYPSSYYYSSEEEVEEEEEEEENNTLENENDIDEDYDYYAALLEFFGTSFIDAKQRKLMGFDWNSYNSPANFNSNFFNYNPPSPSKSVSSTSNSKQEVALPNTLKKDLSIQNFDIIWNALKPELSLLNDNGLWLIPESGNGLLSTKIAKKFPLATVVSTESSLSAFREQQRLSSILGVESRVLLCYSQLYDISTVQTLLHTPMVANYQIIDGRDILPLLSKLPFNRFQEYLASFISLSSTTFLYLPSLESLQFSASLFNFEFPPYDSMEEFIEETIDNLYPAKMKIRSSKNDYGTIWIITAESIERTIDIGSTSYNIEIKQNQNQLRVYHLKNGEKNLLQNSVIGYQANLGGLLHLNISDTHRKQLMQSYQQLELQQNMHPSTLFVDNYSNITYFIPGFEARKSPSPSQKAYDIYDLLNSQIPEQEFSMLHLNSGTGELSNLIAQTNIYSTIISIEGSEENFAIHDDYVHENQIYNNLVCRKSPRIELFDIIRQSPEFFQYVLVTNPKHVLQIRPYTEYNVQTYFSRAVTLGINTFFELPSSEMISLLATTFYPESLQPGSISFELDDHPLNYWKQSSLRFISSVIKGEGLHEIEIQQLPKTNPSFEFIQVKTLNMSRIVGHHFKLPENFNERHKRQYELNHYYGKTYLIRQEDESYISYDEFGISLVAALRMNPSEETKERLYKQFVSLPIYEDMAPWNIQFKAGNLQYVDKDSSESSFDWLLPYAYQFLISLINWKETIRQFDHCTGRGIEINGAPMVGSCMSDIPNNKCKDPDYPIPCADDKCYPTFVECLRELALLDKDFLKQLQLAKMNDDKPQTNITILY